MEERAQKYIQSVCSLEAHMGRPRYVYKEYYTQGKQGSIGDFVMLYYIEDSEIKNLKAMQSWFPCYIRMCKGF